jgi:hypothetical protein
MSSHGQPTRGGPLASALGKELKIHHCVKPSCYEMSHEESELDGFFGKT